MTSIGKKQEIEKCLKPAPEFNESESIKQTCSMELGGNRKHGWSMEWRCRRTGTGEKGAEGRREFQPRMDEEGIMSGSSEVASSAELAVSRALSVCPRACDGCELGVCRVSRLSGACRAWSCRWCLKAGTSAVRTEVLAVVAVVAVVDVVDVTEVTEVVSIASDSLAAFVHSQTGSTSRCVPSAAASTFTYNIQAHTLFDGHIYNHNHIHVHIIRWSLLPNIVRCEGHYTLHYWNNVTYHWLPGHWLSMNI